MSNHIVLRLNVLWFGFFFKMPESKVTQQISVLSSQISEKKTEKVNLVPPPENNCLCVKEQKIQILF